MTHLTEWIRRWLTPLVFVVWTYALIYLLATSRYTIFLRPEFGLLLAVAHFIAMGFMLAVMTRSPMPLVDGAGILRVMILLIPLIYLAVMPDTSPGAGAFRNRFVGPTWPANGGSDTAAALSAPLAAAEITISDRHPGYGQNAIPALERTIVELYMTGRQLDGQRVVFTGMVLHDENLKSYFGGRETVVYRFLMNCCAADMIPLAIAVDSEQLRDFSSDQWVRVTGWLRVTEANGKHFPLVDHATVITAEAPKIPYLF